MAEPISEDVQRQIRETWEVHGEEIGVTGVARLLGVTRSAVYKYNGQPNYTNTEPDEATEPSSDKMEREETGSKASVTFETDRTIRTLEDAIAHAEVDLTTWRVKTWRLKTWTVALRVRMGQDDKGRNRPDKPHVKQMYGVSMTLERIQPSAFELATAEIAERIASPCVPYSPKPRPHEPHLLVMGLFDAHFGKLAWEPETGENYDLRIAERVYSDAVQDLLSRASGHAVSEILFPIGNDFFHVDTSAMLTANGTPQDTDGRYAKIIAAGNMAVLNAIEEARKHAPVRVVRVPGNHDRYASLHLLEVLKARYANVGGVTIEASIKDRQYHVFGCNLIGMTHGNEEAHASLPTIMATEEPILWAATTCREWLLGHFHKSKRTAFTEIDTHTGVVVRVLRALSGRDAWHYRRGYVGGQRAAEGLLYSETQGFVLNAMAYIRRDDAA